MSWSTPAASDVLSELSPSEATALQAALGGSSPSDKITPILGRVVAEIRGYIQSGGYALDVAGTLPTGLLSDCVVITRWRVLVSLPANDNIQSKERKASYDAAMKKLVLIGERKFAVESPTAGVNPRTGQWNSEEKLIMRTHPVPRPLTQLTGTGPDYANANVGDG